MERAEAEKPIGSAGLRRAAAKQLVTEDDSKFAAVAIIYDTAPVRSDFDKFGAIFKN